MKTAENLFSEWLMTLGFVGDPEMEQTARRFTELMSDFVPQPDDELLAGFTLVGTDSLPGAVRTPVAVRCMPFHSMCAHHLVPFFGLASVAYLPGERLAGFGSIARIVKHFAKRPQLQERMAEQVADILWQALEPKGLVVRLVARQMCMEMRGAEVHGEVEVIAVRGQADSGLQDMARVDRSLP